MHGSDIDATAHVAVTVASSQWLPHLVPIPLLILLPLLLSLLLRSLVLCCNSRPQHIQHVQLLQQAAEAAAADEGTWQAKNWMVRKQPMSLLSAWYACG
jgi:hypothetical protein